ncbi:hypothetical protein AB0L66_10710 [Streptomyces sp. NPDC052207]|uniref:hypothetical protein n=1 Tax=Streptomyces sp. NPDC052207 TaxID=3155418 RepID=UPI003421D45A
MNGPGHCPDCRRPVLWTRTEPGVSTEGGKRLAVDPTPNPDGNTAVHRDGTGRYVSRRVTEERPLWGPERLHMPHPATCPRRQTQIALPQGVIRLADHRRKRRP